MKNWHAYYSTLLEKTAIFLLLVYPSLFLLVKGGMNSAMFLMLLLALFVRLLPPASLSSPVWKKEWWIYVAAMPECQLRF